jgi:hypothetical protein
MHCKSADQPKLAGKLKSEELIKAEPNGAGAFLKVNRERMNDGAQDGNYPIYSFTFLLPFTFTLPPPNQFTFSS